MAGCLRITVDLGSSANEFVADRFVRSVELSLLSTVDSEWAVWYSLRKLLGSNSTSAGRLPVPPAAPSKSRLIAVRNMPHSGKPDELIDAFGISAKHLVEAVSAIA